MSRSIIMTLGVMAIWILSPLTSGSGAEETPSASTLSGSDHEETPSSPIFLRQDGLHLDVKELELKMKFGGRIHYDAGTMDADEAAESVFPNLDARSNMFRRARLCVSGTQHDRLYFKSEVEFTQSGSFEPQLMDTWLGVSDVPLLGEIQAGHMKEPFSLEELASSNDITFMERSLPTDAFAPARNVGVMSHRTLLEQRMTVALGGFGNTGPLTFANFRQTIDDINGFHLGTRFTAVPWYVEQGQRLLHVGLSYSHAFQDDDETKYSTLPESYLVNEKLVSTGDFFTEAADRVNPELAIVIGPFSVQSEFFYVFGQATPDVHFWGYYLYASYFLTGESRPYDRASAIFSQVKPLHAFRPWCGEWGAWELGLRYSYVDLNSDSIQGGVEKNFTVGLNAYLSANIRLMFNYVRAHVKDLAEPGGDDGRMNIFQGRFQIAF